MTLLTLLVKKREEGIRLLPFLRQYCPPSYSGRALKRLIDQKQCKVNGQIVMVSTRPLSGGDRVELSLAKREKGDLEVLYDDPHLVVVNKVPGVVCEKGALNELLPQYGHTLIPIHRLDKETSGVLLLARDEAFKEEMVALFRKKEVKKVYQALVDGCVTASQGTCRGRIEKGKLSSRVVPGERGKEAVTHWRRLKAGKEASLVELELETGRTHQIRVHMGEWGHPILGDVLYQKRAAICSWTPQRNLLHALSISFIHPVLQKKVSFKAPLPHDFKSAMNHCLK